MAIGTSVLAATFSDLAGHWAYDNIMKLADTGVINGYLDGTYRPENTVTRGEFIKLVIQASLPEGVDIADAPSSLAHWSGKHLATAEIYRVVDSGSITLENVDQPITRREMALIISKADVMLRFKTLNTDASITYNDYDLMNAEEIRWLTHAVSTGYITGYTDNTFKPDKNMTRAEAATIIARYTGMVGESK